MRKAFVIGLCLLGAMATRGVAGVPDDRLVQAVRGSDHKALQTLLAAHVDPNAPLPDKSTVLAWAVDRQDLESVRLLLKAGADPNISDMSGTTPMALACQLGKPDIVLALLGAGGDAKTTRADGTSALELCARGSTPVVLERLIAGGADVNAADPLGQTPLMWAAEKGRTGNMTVLIKHGADVNAVTRKGWTPLMFALKSEVATAPSVLTAAGADVQVALPNGMSVVEAALIKNNVPFVMQLVSSDAIDVKHQEHLGRQLIHLAALHGSADLVKLALAKGADPNALTSPPPAPLPTKEVEPPPAPVVPGQPLPLKVGIASTLPPPPPMPTTPLLLAAQAGSVATMKALVDAGAKPDAVSAIGDTLTLAAANGGDLEALKFAVQLDPDVNAVNRLGRNVFHMVVANEHGADYDAMLRYLADKGAKLEVKDYRGITPGLFVNAHGVQALRLAYLKVLADHGMVSAFH
jgi:ankyrin repeat protein